MNRVCAREGNGTPGGAGNAAGFKERRPAVGPVLAVLVAVGALCQPVQADVLVSNIGQVNDSSQLAFSSFDLAQGFTTGSAGATLDSIDILLTNASTVDQAASEVSAELFKDDLTGTSVATLTSTDTITADSSGNYTFTAPANTTLDASTTYYVLFQASLGSINAERTRQVNEDSGGADGWSIANGHQWRNATETGSFQSALVVLMIRVNGTADTVTASDVDTLGALALADEFGAKVELDPAFATGTTAYGAEVANAVARITVAAEPTDSDATLAYEDGDGNALTDLDGDAEHFQADIAPGENVVKVVVTAENDTDTETYTVTVTRGTAVDGDAVPGDWSLKPNAVGPGDRFRLLFVSSTTRDADSTDIDDYNAHVQAAAAAGHADIQPFADGFTVVGSTADVNVRANTLTRADDVDAAIYWVRASAGRSAVADDYADFYDGTWGDTSPRSETGAAASMTSTNRPVTGSNADGTTPSGVLGGDRNFDLVVAWHLSGSSVFASGTESATDQSRLIALSPIFRAAGGPSASLTALSVADGGGEAVALSPEFTPATTTYAATVESRRATVLAEPADALATVAYFDGEGAAIVDQDGGTEGLQVDLETGANVVRVTVTATDGIATRTYEVTVTSAYPTLVHNTGQTVETDTSNDVQAQGFTTGSDPGGYRVGSVSVRLGALGTGVVDSDTHVRIFSEDSGPDASIAALTSPTLQGDAFNVFTAPERVFLDPDTTYHVMVNRGLDSARRVHTNYTAGDAQSSDHGWTIANDRRASADNTPTSWNTRTNVLLMEVRGEVLPECTVDLGGRTEIWTGVVTVGEGKFLLDPNRPPDFYGYHPGTPAGALSDTEFDFGSTMDHEVWQVYVENSEDLLLSLSNSVATTDRPALRLHACGDAFDLADGPLNSSGQHEWRNSGLDWSDAYKVTLALSASPDASLDGLAANGTSVPGFASNDYDYAVTVSNATTRITVEPTVAERGALVTFLDGADAALADADTATDVFDVDLAVGANTVKVRVVSGDRANTLTYVVTVTRNTITVTNNDPTFNDGASTSRSVDENTPSGTDFGAAVEASDIDVGDILTYSLGGTDGSSFGIDTATGQLRTSAALNFESDSSYSVTVGVDDGSGGTDSIDVTITVNDQNEKPDTPAAPTVTTTADTTDSLTVTWTKPGLNGGPDIVGYKLRYQSDGAWAEVPSTITATTHTIPNLAEGTTYQVQVRALNDGETDSDWSPSGSGTTGSSSNNPPEFDEGATAMRSVDENTGSGTAIGNPVSATDDDGDTLTYTLEGTDRTSFGIVARTGQLLTSAALDFESDSSHSVRVKVEDTNNGSATIDVTITVNDRNEKPDRPGAPTVTATADTTDSLTVRWTKPGLNGGPDIVGYKLRYRSDGAWTEVPSTITATTHTIPGLAAGTEYQVQVRALNDGETDSDWSPSGTGNTGSASNNAPTFDDGTSTTRRVAEDAAPGTAIGTPVAASDDDGDGLTYTLEGTDRTSFRIDSRTGQLRTSAPLDYETKPSHSVRVKADDGNNGTATIAVTIEVEDVAEEATAQATFYPGTLSAGEVVTVARAALRLVPGLDRTVTVPLTTTHVGGATEADYEGVPPSVTFEPGETEEIFRVRAVNDDVDDDCEAVIIGFGTMPSGVSPGRYPTLRIELRDDDGIATWYVSFEEEAYTAAEGGTATVAAVLSDPWMPCRREALTLGLGVHAHGGGATAADYVVPESVTFAEGATRATFTVRAVDDAVDDDGESVTLEFLGHGFPGALRTGRGPLRTVVSLADDDGAAPVEVSFGAAAYKAAEGGAPADVEVRLDRAPGREVAVPLTTTRRGASAADYSGVPGRVVFGADETARSFAVTATDDGDEDDGESIDIGFGRLPAAVTAGSPAVATVQLEDDDGDTPKYKVWFDTRSSTVRQLREGGSHWTGATLDQAPDTELVLPLVATPVDGATAADYSDLPANLVFEAGKTRSGFRVRGVDDAEVDPDEGLLVGFGPLPAGVRGRAGSDVATFVIIDNDGPPGVSIKDAGVREAVNTPPLNFRLELDRSADVDASVRWETVNGTATAGEDYVAASGTLEFPAGARSGLIRIETLYDEQAEGTETMTVVLSDPQALRLADASGTGRISDPYGFSGVADAFVTGASLTLRYADPLDAGSTPGPKDWVVRAATDAGPRTLAVTAVSVAGAEVALALSPPAVAGESVSVSYLPWAMHPLLGPDGVEAAPLTELAARNETPAFAPVEERLLPTAAETLAAEVGTDIAGEAVVAPPAPFGPWLAALLADRPAASLVRLDAPDRGLTDVSPLAEFTGLEVLDLRGNALVDAWPLAGLERLRRLDLSDNRIVDVSALAGLAQLEVLLLDGNRVADVLPLALLPRLKRLDLSGNRVADALLLAELRSLARLDLSGNRVGDTSPLGDLSRLLWLDLTGNPVSDAAPLGRLTALRWLWLDAGAPGLGSLAPLGQGPTPVRIELRGPVETALPR